MNYRNLADADLADFSKNIENQLTSHSVDGIDNLLADDLAATLTPINTGYTTTIEAGVTQTAVKQSTIADKQTQREELLTRLATIRNYLVAAGVPRKSYEICGYSAPATPVTVIANDPTDLVASGTSNGVNRIKWSGNNKNGSVTYEIWRLNGDTVPFAIIATTKKQVYVDTPVTPGEVYNYKVRAVASTNMSNFSNIAVVYGAL
ncbi:hypothetical protein BH10ACI3_BH10ACI3_26900 [soil metagenome]